MVAAVGTMILSDCLGVRTVSHPLCRHAKSWRRGSVCQKLWRPAGDLAPSWWLLS